MVRSNRPEDAGPGQVPGFERDVPGRRLVAGRGPPSRVLHQGPAEHARDQGRFVEVRAGPVPDQAAVPHHRDHVRDLQDLREAVRDVQHRHAGGAQGRDHAEEPLGLPLIQRGGGLVHDQDPGVQHQRPPDRDQLAVSVGELLHLAGGVDRHAQPGELVRGPLAHGVRRHQVTAAARAGPAHVHVLGDAEGLVELEFLRDQDDSERLGVAGGAEGDLLAAELDVAGGGADHPRRDLRGRALAGPVLPDERVDLCGGQGHGQLVHRDRGAVDLPDGAQRQQGRGRRGFAGCGLAGCGLAGCRAGPAGDGPAGGRERRMPLSPGPPSDAVGGQASSSCGRVPRADGLLVCRRVRLAARSAG